MAIRYRNTVAGKFIDRPNRFIAHVEIEGTSQTVHVKNTGRCRELLLPGAKVILELSDNPNRKTKWDLIGVEKSGLGMVNIDSQVPNKVVGEWLHSETSIFSGADYIKPEYKYGQSRIDFYIEKDNRQILIEVKGCTLEVDGQGYFPDAPTERGAKHLRELAGSISAGYEAYLVYCIAMNRVEIVHPNVEKDPGYAQALEEAREAGVKVIYLQCEVGDDFITAKEYKVQE